MKKLIYYAFSICTCLMLMSADDCTPPPSAVQDAEQIKVEENQKRLMTETEIPILTKSLERQAIVKRLKLFEDENKVSYIYLISFGKVMAFYPVKGKITSGSKRLTTQDKLICNSTFESGSYSVVESPSLDGTYGSSDAYIFFWTTSNAYIQWNGEYMISDHPLKLSSQPELIYNTTPNK